MTIVAAADGSALGNPGPAGWAWYVDDTVWACGGWPHGTNNMGELMAVLDLLRQTAHTGQDLLVYCDSTYVINSITKWMPGWKRKGWRKGDGKPVMNVEIIKAIDEAMTGRRVTFQWVKGHAGHSLNEAADKLANGAALAWQRGAAPAEGPGYPGAQAAPDEAGEQTGKERLPAAARPDAAASATLFDELVGEEAGTTTEPSDERTVIELERSLLTSQVRSDPDALARLLHPMWSEIGSSGRILDRESTLSRLGPVDATLDVIECSRLADDVILLIWRAIDEGGSRLRSSVWLRTDRGWQQRFHQGTVES